MEADKNVDKWEMLEKVIIDLKDKNDPESTRTKVETYRKLGHLKAELGFAELGLEDLLRSYALHQNPRFDAARKPLKDLRGELVDSDPHFPARGTPWKLLVMLGDAFRIYARDVDFSVRKQAVARTLKTMTSCFRCFHLAMSDAGAAPEKERAWFQRHVGAAFTMGFWLQTTLGDDVGEAFSSIVDDLLPASAAPDVKDAKKSALFDAADQAFQSSHALVHNAWCQQFRAFLFTLRGSANDFDTARKLLEEARQLSHRRVNDASLDRSLSILAFNLAGQSKEEASERARESLAYAVRGMESDNEDSEVSFWAAASMQRLTEDKKLAPYYERNLRLAYTAARRRIHNTLSRSYATMVALSALQSIDGAGSAKEAKRCKMYVKRARKLSPDLETRIVFDRTVRSLLQVQGIDPELRKELFLFLENFEPGKKK